MLRTAEQRSHARPSPTTVGLLLISASATAAIVVTGKHVPAWAFLGMLATAVGAFFLLLRAETKHPTLRCWMVFVPVAVLMAIAVAFPPRTSNDVWAYSIYGRIVTAHNTSPYVHAPEDFPTDPYYARARRGYSSIKSVYGPVWTGISAGVMEVADEQKTVARVLFQGIAALAVLGALVLLWRRTKDAAVIAFAGLNPIVAASVVNGGHNDALVGLAVLGGAFAAPAHPIIAGLVLGAGASIKVVGLLPLVAVVLWAWYRRGVRHASLLLASSLAVLAVGYILVGGLHALGPLKRGSRLIVRHSFWYYPRQWMVSGLRATGLSKTDALLRAGHQIGMIGTGLVVGATVIVVLARLRRQRPEQLAGASLVPYLFGAPYVLPWYPAWLLPSLATSRKTVLARLVAVESILVFVADPDRFLHVHGTAGDVIHTLTRSVTPLFALAVMIGLVSSGVIQIVSRRRGPKHVPESGPVFDGPNALSTASTASLSENR